MTLLTGGSLNLLEVNPGLVIWTVITFLVVLAVLWLFAWNPIIKALDDRNSRVQDDLDKSRQLREEAEKLLKDYRDKLESAKKEAMQLLDAGRKDAEDLKNRILQDAQNEAASIRERANRDIEQAKLNALAELEKRVVDLTMRALGSVMQKDIADQEHKQLVLKRLGEIKQEK